MQYYKTAIFSGEINTIQTKTKNQNEYSQLRR